MTTPVDAQAVEGALQRARLEWLLAYWGADKGARLAQLARDISDFIEEYAARFKHRPDPFKLLDENPEKGKAFFQFDSLMASREAKIVIWRILLGCEIKQLHFDYDRRGDTRLKIQLLSPYGEREEYESQHWADFRVLRHLGTMQANQRLRLEGYYAAKA